MNLQKAEFESILQQTRIDEPRIITEKTCQCPTDSLGLEHC